MSEEGRIYQVEKIIGRKEDRQGNIFYRVHWVGYGPRYDSWEPVGNLGSCEDLIEEFYEHQTAQKSPADRYYLRSRHVARADRESSTVLLSSDDEDTPKSKAKTTKRASVRQRKKEKSKSPVRRTKQAPTDKEEKKQQEEEKEQPLPQVEKPLPAKLQEGPKEETKPRQPTETSTSVTAGLSARTYDLRSAHRRQATSRLAGLEISSDEDETSIAGSTPTQRSTVQSRMTLSESKFRSRLSKIQSGQTTVPLDSSPSVTRRLQFTSTISKEPEEEIEVKEEEQVSTSGTVEQSSHAGEAIVPSGSSSSEELEERVPAWMQIARAEVGFAVLVTLFGIVGYFCYYTDHCSHFYH